MNLPKFPRHVAFRDVMIFPNLQSQSYQKGQKGQGGWARLRRLGWVFCMAGRAPTLLDGLDGTQQSAATTRSWESIRLGSLAVRGAGGEPLGSIWVASSPTIGYARIPHETTMSTVQAPHRSRISRTSIACCDGVPR